MQQGMQSYFRGGFTPFVVFLTAVTVVEAVSSQYKIQCFDCNAIHAALMDLAYRKVANQSGHSPWGEIKKTRI